MVMMRLSVMVMVMGGGAMGAVLDRSMEEIATNEHVVIETDSCPNSCSLNGVCEAGKCVCDEGWTWDDCSRLDFLPAPSSVSFHGLNVNRSSWGGSVLQLPDGNGKKQWAMFAAEMTHGCTLRHWTTNSEVVLATSDSPMGPYTEQIQIIQPWAHNPEAIQTADGNVVVYTLGDGIPVHGPEVPCDSPNPVPPSPGPPPPPPSPPSDAVHDVNFLIHYAPIGSYTDKSAWKTHNATILDFPVMIKWEGNWNPAPVSLPESGKVRIMAHTGYSLFYNSSNNSVAGWSGEVVIEADTWRGPYRMITSRDITNCTHCEEDPFMWRDHRGHWHVIYHRMFDNGTSCEGYPSFNPDGKVPPKPCKSPEGLWSMGHSYSTDGISWSPISRCANTTAPLVGGKSITFNSRERPKLVMGENGRPAFLSNAVQPFQSAGPDAGITHTLVVPLNVEQNRKAASFSGEF